MKDYLACVLLGLLIAFGCVILLAWGITGFWLILNGHLAWGALTVAGCLGVSIGTVVYLGDR